MITPEILESSGFTVTPRPDPRSESSAAKVSLIETVRDNAEFPEGAADAVEDVPAALMDPEDPVWLTARRTAAWLDLWRLDEPAGIVEVLRLMTPKTRHRFALERWGATGGPEAWATMGSGFLDQALRTSAWLKALVQRHIDASPWDRDEALADLKAAGQFQADAWTEGIHTQIRTRVPLAKLHPVITHPPRLYRGASMNGRYAPSWSDDITVAAMYAHSSLKSYGVDANLWAITPTAESIAGVINFEGNFHHLPFSEYVVDTKGLQIDLESDDPVRIASLRGRRLVRAEFRALLAERDVQFLAQSGQRLGPGI